MFHGVFHLDDIRQVYKECHYDVNQTISELLDRKEKLIQDENLKSNQKESHGNEKESLEKIMRQYGHILDRESAEMIFIECEKNYEMTCENICQLYEIPPGLVSTPFIDHSESTGVVVASSDKHTQQTDSNERKMIEETYQDILDIDIIHAIVDSCEGDLTTARSQLEELSNLKNSPHAISLDVSSSIEPFCALDSLTLVSLVRLALSDFLPDDAVNQFLLHNSINETLPISRLEFILNQIMLVIGMISSIDEEGSQELSANESNDALEVVLSQCDSEMIPVDWTFNSLELSLDGESSCWSQDLSLLEVLSFGNTLSAAEAILPSPREPDLNSLESARQMLNTLNESATEQLVSDDMILSALDAYHYDLDQTIATLSRTLEQLQEHSANAPRASNYSHLRTGRVKKNSGVRTKGRVVFSF
jgi:hypothetical protein